MQNDSLPFFFCMLAFRRAQRNFRKLAAKEVNRLTNLLSIPDKIEEILAAKKKAIAEHSKRRSDHRKELQKQGKTIGYIQAGFKFLNSLMASMLELKVVVVIKNSKLFSLSLSS